MSPLELLQRRIDWLVLANLDNFSSGRGQLGSALQVVLHRTGSCQAIGSCFAWPPVQTCKQSQVREGDAMSRHTRRRLYPHRNGRMYQPVSLSTPQLSSSASVNSTK